MYQPEPCCTRSRHRSRNQHGMKHQLRSAPDSARSTEVIRLQQQDSQTCVKKHTLIQNHPW